MKIARVEFRAVKFGKNRRQRRGAVLTLVNQRAGRKREVVVVDEMDLRRAPLELGINRDMPSVGGDFLRLTEPGCLKMGEAALAQIRRRLAVVGPQDEKRAHG